MEFRSFRVVPKYLNSSTLSKDLLSIFMLWLCPAFWFRDMTMYLVFSAFTSRPISLLAITYDCMNTYKNGRTDGLNDGVITSHICYTIHKSSAFLSFGKQLCCLECLRTHDVHIKVSPHRRISERTSGNEKAMKSTEMLSNALPTRTLQISALFMKHQKSVLILFLGQ
jgi:hypothetical protein